jgi:hypothetical protein
MVETAAVLHQVSKVTFCMTSLRSQFAPKEALRMPSLASAEHGKKKSVVFSFLQFQ